MAPLGLYLLMGVAMADLRNAPGAHAISDVGVFLSFATFAALYPGMAIIDVQLATERSQGLPAYKRALPMPPASYVGAKIFMALAFGVIVIGLLMVLASTVWRRQDPGWPSAACSRHHGRRRCARLRDGSLHRLRLSDRVGQCGGQRHIHGHDQSGRPVLSAAAFLEFDQSDLACLSSA